MILLVGQIERTMRGRDAFQEVDYPRLFGGMAKWVAEIDHPARVPEMLGRAFHTAMAGRPGPVVLALPEDMLVETASVGVLPRIEVGSPVPSAADMARVAGALSAARAPVIVAGGSRWDVVSAAGLAEVAAAWHLPVAVSFRRQELIAGMHPSAAGELAFGPNPELIALVRDADLLLILGDRFSEVPSQGYELIGLPQARQRLIHVHPGPEEIGRVYAPWLGLAVAPGAFVAALADLPRPSDPPWAARTTAMHASYLAWSEPQGGDLMSRLMAELNARLPADAVVTTGAGNYAIWPGRYRRSTGFGSGLGPTSGSMGYGLPAAIAAGLRHPGRPVVCFAGDGCLQMTVQEMATVVQERLPLRLIVADNRQYGTIRAHQARAYPGRITGTQLVNPDFAALARAYGFAAWRVEGTDAVRPAVEAMLGHDGPALLHLMTDPAQVTPGPRLTDI